jgi:DNA-binding CsgD family transcriptional regulator/tetratricopeptide (TPR) repeat protein
VENNVGMTFVGRTGELRVLHDAFRAACEQRVTVALVEGLPGIGKTSLIERFLHDLVGARVLRASGDEWEVDVSLGVIDQLLRVAGEPGLLAAGERALTDQVAVGLRLLDLVGSLEDDGPVVIAVDDAHWADEASLRALVFAVRRMSDESVLVILAVREGEDSRLPEGLTKLAAGATIAVSPLEAEEIRALAEADGVMLSAGAARRLQEHTTGNPLHAHALLHELPPEAWHDADLALPAPRTFSALVVRRAERTTPAARALAGAAAVLGRTQLADAAAVAGLEDPLEALEGAIAAGLLVTDVRRGSVSFEHPLVRAALYHDLGPAARARLHRRAAELATTRVAALRHRVAAASAPDPALADDLEVAAREEAGRGAGPAAAALLLEAGRLSADHAERDQRLLEAVDALLSAGRRAEASRHLHAIAAMPESPRRNMVLGQAAVQAGDLAEGERRLASAWECCDPAAEPELAAAIALHSAYYWMGELRGPETALWAGRAMELTQDAPDAAGPLAWGLLISGDSKRALEILDRAVARPLDGVTDASGSLARSLRGALRFFSGDLQGALADLSSTAAAALSVGSTIAAVTGHAWLAEVEFHAGRWEDATMHIDRAVALSLASDEWLPSTSFALATMSRLAIERGDLDAAEDAVRHLGEHVAASVSERAITAIARARLLAARADAPEEVLRLLGPLTAEPAGSALHEPGFFTWHSLYADALLALGRYDEADAFLSAGERGARARENAPVLARFARLRGRLEAARGSIDSAETAFRHALEQDVGMPYELALSHLAYGQLLRRQGQRRAAADQLGRARERFVTLQALPALERCERELVACGLEPGKRSSRDRFQLTPQETVVAKLAASGMTNRQIATELLVSTRTVGVHLTRIYAKLGVHSRADLADIGGPLRGAEVTAASP